MNILETIKDYSGFSFIINDDYRYYLKRLMPIYWVMLLLKLIEFVVIYGMMFSQMSHSFVGVMQVLVLIFVTTFLSFMLFSIPFTLYLVCISSEQQYNSLDKTLTIIFAFAMLYTLNFEKLGTSLFWQELGGKFGFFSADVSAFTGDSLGFFYSYHPVIGILIFIFFIAALVFCIMRNYFFPIYAAPELGGRLKGVLEHVGITAGFYAVLWLCGLLNNFSLYNNNIITNSTTSFFSDLMYNRKFERVYASADMQKNIEILQRGYQGRTAVQFASKNSIIKRINNPGTEQRMNVFLVVMRGMDAVFINRKLDNGLILTPSLNVILNHSIYFNNVYATGASTTNGLDALVFSIPALANKSIIQRKHNEDLYNISTIFNRKGYESKFVYGGYGHVDNMRNFFSSNGYGVVDRSNFTPEEVHFENIMGVSDEDLFAKAIKEADQSVRSGKRFFNVVLTSSNRRPYSFPTTALKFPAGTLEEYAAVRYADYAIGQFLKAAQNKRWFANTMFVFVADTTSLGERRAGLNTADYRIPLIIYASGNVAPRRYSKIISQIDVMPTVLSLLRFNYESRFYGNDATDNNFRPRYFITNNHTLRYISNDIETIMRPNKIIFNYSETKQSITSNRYKEEAIAYFQSAYYWRDNLSIKPPKSVVEKK